MYFKCKECGHVFEDGEQATWVESHGLDYGGEEFEGCHICKGDYEEAEECEKCGKVCGDDEIFGGLCDECIEEYKYDVNMCYKIGKHEKHVFNLNVLFAHLFTENEIEDILLRELSKDKYVDCSSFINENKDWFGEKILEVYSNEQ
jgi:hypothetical protein